MAYTVRIAKGEPARFVKVLEALADGAFTFKAEVAGKGGQDVILRPVRLVKAKPYCGQHPGECVLGGPKKNGKWLEWDDWVAFHGLVNDALDVLKFEADAWTNPPERLESGSKMFVRRNNKRRTQWDWEETEDKRFSFRTIRVWNPGLDESQYE